jgi:hypothetical protein
LERRRSVTDEIGLFEKFDFFYVNQRRAPRARWRQAARWRPRRPRPNVKFGFFFGGRAAFISLLNLPPGGHA